MKILTPVRVIILFAVGFMSCNPDCESLLTTNIVVPVGPYPEGTELAIRANPAEILDGREIHLSYRSNNAVRTDRLNAEFRADLGATVVEIPFGVTPDASLLIDDPDCSGQLIPIGSQTEIVDPAFFLDNPLFVTPTPPLIIIPTPPVQVPTNIVNAWFSPNDRNYCIWFNPVQDTLADGTIIGLPQLLPPDSPNGQGPRNGSVELAAGCSHVPDSDNKLYHDNPVTGIVDVPNNYIRIRIDRTAKGLTVEEYEGELIGADQMPAEYDSGGACSANGDPEPFYMLLTSVQTGRQLVLFHVL